MQNGDSSFYMWGERGLVATFFADLHAASLAGLELFLSEIQIDSPSFPRSGTRLITIIEPDFSNTGFGHPDVVIRLDNGADPAVIILEAKRCPFAHACWPSTLRSAEGFNSTLNGQLELDYALALALSEHKPSDSELCEPEWILRTPYGGERDGKLRRLKNQHVLRDVVCNFAGLPLERYFFVALTTDVENPFQSVSAEILPNLYHEEHGYHNCCWSNMRSQFGWVNYDILRKTIHSLHDRGLMKSESLFLSSLELNLKNMESSRSRAGSSSSELGRGAAMIFVPTIDSSTFLHFSWLGESCALRNYSLGPQNIPCPDRRHNTSEIRQLSQRQVSVTDRRPVTDTGYWHKKTIELNLQFLAKSSMTTHA